MRVVLAGGWRLRYGLALLPLLVLDVHQLAEIVFHRAVSRRVRAFHGLVILTFLWRRLLLHVLACCGICCSFVICLLFEIACLSHLLLQVRGIRREIAELIEVLRSGCLLCLIAGLIKRYLDGDRMLCTYEFEHLGLIGTSLKGLLLHFIFEPARLHAEIRFKLIFLN